MAITGIQWLIPALYLDAANGGYGPRAPTGLYKDVLIFFHALIMSRCIMSTTQQGQVAEYTEQLGGISLLFVYLLWKISFIAVYKNKIERFNSILYLYTLRT